jgi:Methyltransferase domain
VNASLLQRAAQTRASKRMLETPLAVVAAFPFRAAAVVRHNFRVTAAGTRWLFRSRENTNFTYDLTERNLRHLAWFVANHASIGVTEARDYLDEVRGDAELARHIATAVGASPARWLADRTARYGRRVGWYALIRATKPKVVVETGTDKGLGSVVIAAALLRNGSGHLTTIDINPKAGYLISGPYAAVTSLVIGDSVASIAALRDVNIFIHDSDHSAEYEAKEFDAVESKLAPKALVLSDNSHNSDSLPVWAERTGRKFDFFDERPSAHWYPGAGIGLAF